MVGWTWKCLEETKAVAKLLLLLLPHVLFKRISKRNNTRSREQQPTNEDELIIQRRIQ